MKNSLSILSVVCTCISCANAGGHLEATPTNQGYGTSRRILRVPANEVVLEEASDHGYLAKEAAGKQHLVESGILERPFPSLVPLREAQAEYEPLHISRHLSEDGLNHTADELHHSEDGHNHTEDEHDHPEDEHDHPEDEHDHPEDEHDHSEDGHAPLSGTMSASEEAKKKPWGTVIGVSLLVNLSALSGVLLLIPLLARDRFCGQNNNGNRNSGPMCCGSRCSKGKIMNIVIPSFACGALLAAAVFLIMPESFHLIASGSASVNDGHDHGDHGHDGHLRHLEGDEEGGSESETAWKFGTSILGGFLLPVVLGAFFPRPKEQELEDEIDQEEVLPCVSPSVESQCEQCLEEGQVTGKDDCTLSTSMSPSCHDPGQNRTNDHEDKDGFVDEIDSGKVVVGEPVVDNVNLPTVEEDCADQDNVCKHGVHHAAQRNINYRLCVSILVGDGFHNFADGIFVATSFMLCTNSVAYSIVVATLYHEIAQELADFFLLTSHGGLRIIPALCLNFCSGLFILLGGITVLASDLTSEAIGVILGIAGGVYIHIGASECVPRVDSAIETWKDRLLSILMFALGAIPIGLVLISHKHCDG